MDGWRNGCMYIWMDEWLYTMQVSVHYIFANPNMAV